MKAFYLGNDRCSNINIEGEVKSAEEPDYY